MGQIRDDGLDQDSGLDRAARLLLVLTLLGTCLVGVAVAENATTPPPATPGAVADDPGAPAPVEATAGMALPSATGPAAGAGMAAGLGVAAGLFSRYGGRDDR